MQQIFSQIALVDVIGLLGVAFYTGNYALVALGRCRPNSAGFFMRNGLGASCILITLMQTFNTSAFVLQLFYVAISLFGLFNLTRRAKHAISEDPAPSCGQS